LTRYKQLLEVKDPQAVITKKPVKMRPASQGRFKLYQKDKSALKDRVKNLALAYIKQVLPTQRASKINSS